MIAIGIGVDLACPEMKDDGQADDRVAHMNQSEVRVVATNPCSGRVTGSEGGTAMDLGKEIEKERGQEAAIAVGRGKTCAKIIDFGAGIKMTNAALLVEKMTNRARGVHRKVQVIQMNRQKSMIILGNLISVGPR